MDLGLTDRVALVSGASRGIGRATAERLALEGCRVVVVSRRAAEASAAAEAITTLARDFGGEAHPAVGDMTVEADIVRVVAETEQRFGGVDIAISNVLGHVIDADREGAGPGAGTFASMPSAGYAHEFDQLFRSAWILARETVPGMRARRWGRLVNVNSRVAREPQTDIPHVLPNTVRPAVAGFQRLLAHRLGGVGITSNTVLTGGFATERNRAYFTWLAAERGQRLSDLLSEVTAGIPARRMGEPAEMAALIAFLCSTRAAAITGQSIPVDGGASRHL